MSIQQLRICAKLSQDLGRQGKNQQALNAARQGLQISLKLFGSKNSNTAIFYGQVAAALTEMQNYEQSIKLNLEALQIFENQKPIDYKRIATTKDCIARAYRQNKNYEKSKQLYQELIEFQRKNLKGEQREQLAMTLVNYAGLCWALNQTDKSLTCYEEAILESQKHLGKNHHISLTAKKNMEKLKYQQKMMPPLRIGQAFQLLMKRKEKSQTVHQS